MTLANGPVDVRGRNPQDEHNLKIDLLEQLLSTGVVSPESIATATVREWFPTRERHVADRLVADLTANPDCSIEHVSNAENEIWLTDADATREFVADLRDDPAWFDA